MNRVIVSIILVTILATLFLSVSCGCNLKDDDINSDLEVFAEKRLNHLLKGFRTAGWKLGEDITKEIAIDGMCNMINSFCDIFGSDSHKSGCYKPIFDDWIRYKLYEIYILDDRSSSDDIGLERLRSRHPELYDSDSCNDWERLLIHESKKKY